MSKRGILLTLTLGVIGLFVVVADLSAQSLDWRVFEDSEGKPGITLTFPFSKDIASFSFEVISLSGPNVIPEKPTAYFCPAARDGKRECRISANVVRHVSRDSSFKIKVGISTEDRGPKQTFTTTTISVKAASPAGQIPAAGDQEAREQAARDQAAREQAVREQEAREQAARDQAAREQAARDQAAREQAARDQAARDQAARDQAAREQAARDQAARDQAARDQAAQEARDQEARDQEAQAARDQEARDQADREQAAREQAPPEQAVREAARDRASQGVSLLANLSSNSFIPALIIIAVLVAFGFAWRLWNRRKPPVFSRHGMLEELPDKAWRCAIRCKSWKQVDIKLAWEFKQIEYRSKIPPRVRCTFQNRSLGTLTPGLRSVGKELERLRPSKYLPLAVAKNMPLDFKLIEPSSEEIEHDIEIEVEYILDWIDAGVRGGSWTGNECMKFRPLARRARKATELREETLAGGASAEEQHRPAPTNSAGGSLFSEAAPTESATMPPARSEAQNRRFEDIEASLERLVTGFAGLQDSLRDLEERASAVPNGDADGEALDERLQPLTDLVAGARENVSKLEENQAMMMEHQTLLESELQARSSESETMPSKLIPGLAALESGLAGLGQRLEMLEHVPEAQTEDHLAAQVEGIEQSMVGIDQRVEELGVGLEAQAKERVESIERSLAGIDLRVGELGNRLEAQSKDRLAARLVGVERSQAGIGQRIEELGIGLETRSRDRLAERVEGLERSLAGIGQRVGKLGNGLEAQAKIHLAERIENIERSLAGMEKRRQVPAFSPPNDWSETAQDAVDPGLSSTGNHKQSHLLNLLRFEEELRQRTSGDHASWSSHVVHVQMTADAKGVKLGLVEVQNKDQQDGAGLEVRIGGQLLPGTFHVQLFLWSSKSGSEESLLFLPPGQFDETAYNAAYQLLIEDLPGKVVHVDAIKRPARLIRQAPERNYFSVKDKMRIQWS